MSRRKHERQKQRHIAVLIEGRLRYEAERVTHPKVAILAQKQFLEKLLWDCRFHQSISSYEINYYDDGLTSDYHRVDTKDVGPIALEYLRTLESELKTLEFVPLPEVTKPDDDESYPWSEKYAWYHCLQNIRKQREVKRKQRIKAERSSRSTPPKQVVPEDADVLELEFTLKDRSRYCKGWKSEWQPTRNRYWRPNNNNWKEQHKCRKQYLIHLN